jgi:hypothetical protein
LTTDDEDGAVAATFAGIPEGLSVRMGGFKKVEIVNGYGRWKAVQQPWEELTANEQERCCASMPSPRAVQ